MAGLHLLPLHLLQGTALVSAQAAAWYLSLLGEEKTSGSTSFWNRSSALTANVYMVFCWCVPVQQSVSMSRGVRGSLQVAQAFGTEVLLWWLTYHLLLMCTCSAVCVHVKRHEGKSPSSTSFWNRSSALMANIPSFADVYLCCMSMSGGAAQGQCGASVCWWCPGFLLFCCFLPGTSWSVTFPPESAGNIIFFVLTVFLS